MVAWIENKKKGIGYKRIEKRRNDTIGWVVFKGLQQMQQLSLGKHRKDYRLMLLSLMVMSEIFVQLDLWENRNVKYSPAVSSSIQK